MAGRPKLSNEQRQCIVEWLMQQSAVRVGRDTRIKDAAAKFGISRRTIARIWAAARQQINVGIPINVSSKLKGKVGRKPLQFKVGPLIQVVGDAYDSMEAGTLNKVFLTLQNCMIEIMKTKGRNDYKLPHMHKDRLQRQGMLPLNLNVDIDLVKDAMEFLILNQRTEGLEELMVAMGYNQDDTNAGIIDWTATSSSSGVV